MTKEQLLYFIAIRNESSFNTNLQFSFDADVAGFPVTELGDALMKDTDEGIVYYEWDTEHGQLIELGGKLELNPEGF